VVVIRLDRHPKALNRWGTAAGLPEALRFKARVKALPGVVDAGLFNYFVWLPQMNDVHVNGQTYQMRQISGDMDFVKTVGIRTVKGRFPAEDLALKEDGLLPYEDQVIPLLINEAAARMLGTEDPVGLACSWWRTKAQIVGVFADFNDRSLRDPVEPVFFIPNYKTSHFAVRLTGTDVGGTLAAIGEAFRDYNPEYPFEYQFLDDMLDGKYGAERRTQALTRWFTGLAMSVSSLGLFGLAVLTTAQRRKEIGIRKAIGATGRKIFFLLSGEYLKLVLVGNLIAWPVSWYLADMWLAGFADWIDQNVMPYIAGGALTLVVALATVSYQSLSASRVDPVTALREE
jgi:hypothetical protein